MAEPHTKESLDIEFLLDDFQISSEWGFLNAEAEYTSLPSVYNDAVMTAARMGQLLKDHQLRPLFDALNPIAVPESITLPQQRLLFTIYGMLSSAYVFSIHESEERVVLPKSLALPLFQLSEKLGVPPILNYDGYVYSNFRYVQSAALDSEPESYKPIFTFASSKCAEYSSERWFLAGHVGAERRMAPIIFRFLNIQSTLSKLNDKPDDSKCLTEVHKFLDDLAEGLYDIARIVARTRQRLNPDVYSVSTRRYVQPFRGVIFQGVAELGGIPQHLPGETGAQSPLLRSVAAFLGISHQLDDQIELEKHILPAHRNFIKALEASTTVRSVIDKVPELTKGFNSVVDALTNFRISHLSAVAAYLPRGGANSVMTGTARISFETHLGHMLAETIISRVQRATDSSPSSSGARASRRRRDSASSNSSDSSALSDEGGFLEKLKIPFITVRSRSGSRNDVSKQDK